MSTPQNTDLILVERSNVLYKETKANWDTATGGGGGGGGSSATNNLAIQFAHASMGSYASSGSHYYITNGVSYFARVDSSGAYTLSSSGSSTLTNHRPCTKLKKDGTWYEINSSNSVSSTTSAGPLNVYYWRSLISWTLSASEIETACGASSGTIQGLAVRCNSAPSKTMPSHYIGVKLTSLGDTTTNNSGTNNGSYTQVSFANPRNFTGASAGSWIEITFSTNISWS